MATPESSHASSATGASGDNGIDSLLVGMKWDGPVGTASALTFSFATANSVWSGWYTGEPSHPAYAAFPAAGAAAARDILRQYSEIANLTFTEISETSTRVGDLRFGLSGSEPAPAWAYTPGAGPIPGDVWLNAGIPLGRGAFDPGMGGYYLLLHEIGHALGFKHPFEGAPVLPAAQNNHFYSVMASSPSEYGAPVTPMLYDILALQYLYGANMTTRTGDDVYALDPGQEFLMAIWDAGGDDTISAADVEVNSLIPRATTIDLREGKPTEFPIYHFDGFITSVSSGYLTIAYNAHIENAIGSNGKDILIGNSLANSLAGRSGNDRLQGDSGRDSLDGGLGKDTLNGGGSSDTLLGGGSNDTLGGGAGNDRLTGGSGADNFDFTSALNARINVDEVIDFGSGADRIRLDEDFFDALGIGALAANRFHGAAGATQAHDTTDRIIYNTNSGRLYYDADGAGGSASTLFDILTGHPAITNADFVVIA